jgi:hypothetical protein
MGGLKSVPVVVHKAYPDTTSGSTVPRWRLVCTHANQLEWFYTYSRELSEEGTHQVQIYQDNTAQMRRCIRKPKEN